MAGRPGVGKSSVARGVAPAIDAVVLDNDVVKSALLDAGVGWNESATAAWDAVFALAGDFLAQGHSVILDNPSHYESIPKRGQAIAVGALATYAMVECVCADDAVVGQRMADRSRLRSQMTGLGAWSPDAPAPSSAPRTGLHEWTIFRPESNVITVDTSRPLDEVVAEAAAFLTSLG